MYEDNLEADMKPDLKPICLFATALGTLVSVGSAARAELDLDFGAFLQNDVRAAVARVDEPGIARNETILGASVNAGIVPGKLRLIGDLRFVWRGYTRDTGFEGLTSRAVVAPYYLESDAAYFEVYELLPRVDLRIGRQIVNWGAADMFNPTNNLNPLDLEDPVMFGKKIANEMIRVDWYPTDELSVTFAVVPVFEPAMLPESALLAIGDPSSEFPFVDPGVRARAENFRKIWLRAPDRYVVEQPQVRAQMPSLSLKNVQAAVRVQWVMGIFDMSLSYYEGRDALPVPQKTMSRRFETGVKAPDGLEKIGVQTDVTLVYPRSRVVGFDLAGGLPFLDDMGFWFEGAFFFPDGVDMTVDFQEIVPSASIVSGATVSRRPFFKFTTGGDYSLGEHVLVNAQFVRGFANEFGAEKLNNYIVAGFDVKLLQERLILRLFGLAELPHEDDDVTLDSDGDGLPDLLSRGATNDGTICSYVIYPELTYKPLGALELTLGGYFPLGHAESQFGQRAAGPSLAFLRARASF